MTFGHWLLSIDNAICNSWNQLTKNTLMVYMRSALTPSGNCKSPLVSDGKWIKSTFTADGNISNSAWMSHW